MFQGNNKRKMKEIVEVKTKKSISAWGYSFSGLAFAYYSQGSGFCPQHYKKKNFDGNANT